MSLPILTGIGRLTDDPELRFTSGGMAIAKVPLAFNQRKKDDNGNWVDGDTFFITGTLFKQEAENAAESLTKGMEVVVSGRLKTRQWETDGGEKRSMAELLIDAIGPSIKFATAKVQKLSRSNGDGGGGRSGAADPWASAAPARNGGGRGATSNFDEEPSF